MSRTLLRVLRSEGLASAARRAQLRLREGSTQALGRLRAWDRTIPQVTLLNVCATPLDARYGGLPLQLRDRLRHEALLRPVALYTPGRLWVGTRCWSVTDLTQALRACAPEWLHLEGSGGADFAVALNSRCRILLGLHDLDLLHAPQAVREAAFTRAATVVYASPYLARRHAQVGRVIAPGLDWPAVKPGPQDPQHAAFVGLVHANKGAGELLHLIAALPQWRWSVYGGGDAQWLHRLRRAGARIHGFYAAGQLPSLLVRDRVSRVLLPQLQPEGWSLTLSECRLAGVPVVAYDHGAVGARLAAHGGGVRVPVHAGVAGLSAALQATPEPLRHPDAPCAADSAAEMLALYRELGIVR